MAAIKDANGILSTFKYGTFDRIKNSLPAGGEQQEVHYGPLTGSNAPAPTELMVVRRGDSVSFVRHDELDREVERKNWTRSDGLPVVTTIEYDLWSRLPAVITRPHFAGSPAHADIIEYDNLNRVVMRRFADGRIQQFAYQGLEVETWDGPSGNPTTVHRKFTYDRGGRLESSVEYNPVGDHATTYLYGPFGTLDSVTAADVRNIEHDRLGRRLSLTDPTSGRRDYGYNAFGELETELVGSPSGTSETRAIRYDALGRPTLKTTRDGDTTFEWDTSANGLGKLARLTSPDGVAMIFGYDALGRTVQKTWSGGRTREHPSVPAPRYDPKAPAEVRAAASRVGRLLMFQPRMSDIPGGEYIKANRVWLAGLAHNAGVALLVASLYAAPSLAWPT